MPSRACPPSPPLSLPVPSSWALRENLTAHPYPCSGAKPLWVPTCVLVAGPRVLPQCGLEEKSAVWVLGAPDGYPLGTGPRLFSVGRGPGPLRYSLSLSQESSSQSQSQDWSRVA